MQTINDEEHQFMKTLKRGERLLDRRLARVMADPSTPNVLPGDLAWRLYDTFGFPLDLTQLMAEEKGMSVDLQGYEESRRQSHLASRSTAGSGFAATVLDLDVHDINELKCRGVPRTDDSPKYNYSASETDDETASEAAYSFSSCSGRIVALKTFEKFVDTVGSGIECLLLLDQTNFYGEQGGQTFDEGYMTRISGNQSDGDGDDAEFFVKNVQVRGGFVAHIGVTEGTLRVGDCMQLHLDEVRPAQPKNGSRRKLIVFSYTGATQDDHEQSYGNARAELFAAPGAHRRG